VVPLGTTAKRSFVHSDSSLLFRKHDAETSLTRSTQSDLDGVCLKVTVLIAVAFATLFLFVGLTHQGAIKGIACDNDQSVASALFYMSLVTLTSTGYGDIIPVHPLARSLCNMESVIGQFYPATLGKACYP